MNQLYTLSLNHFSLLDKSIYLILRRVSILNHSFHALIKHKDVTIKYSRFYKKKPNFDYNIITFNKKYSYCEIVNQKQYNKILNFNRNFIFIIKILNFS